MKIIKHGCVIHFNCPVCNCEFLMSEDEPECYKRADRDEKKENKEYLAVCPDCGESDVPGYKEKKGELPIEEEQPTEEEKPEEEEPKEEEQKPVEEELPAEEPEEDPEPEDRNGEDTKSQFPVAIK